MSMAISDELKRLHELHLAGALTDTEYEAAKARVLAGPAVDLSKRGDDFGAQVSALRRSRADRWLGGVCGGLAIATAVDSWVWRLMFVLFTLTFGFGLVLYLLLWIFIPEE
jgi:phage shock protein PspC (stress-responsive transcriptional regulator)